MERENNFIEGEKVESKTTYSAVGEVSTKSKKSNFSFGKQVAIPFVSGIVGASVVMASCIGIPSIRETLFNTSNHTILPSESENNSNINTSLISLENFSETGIAVAEKVLPSVVGIKVEYSVSSIFNKNMSSTAEAEGSGIIISEDGYILTNNHIINSSSTSSFYEVGKANKVTVTLYNDETEYEGSIIGTDEQTDLAVIKIDKNGLTAASLGDSDSVRVGEFAMAVGNPLGMQSSVSSGMISAVNRKVTTDGVTFTLIQTDTAINSGNSGGALVNSKGEVIGINTLKMSGSGIEGMGFAIPINSAKPIYEQLVQYNKVKRPYIGISGRDLDEKTAKANNLVVGVYVLSIDEFSAAEKVGIKIGDVITAINGTKITTMDELNQIKNSHNIGDEITLTVNRNGNDKELKVTLQEQ
mgnify:CR=1 FL=1